MTQYLFLLLLIILSSCSTTKSRTNNTKGLLNQINSKIENGGLVAKYDLTRVNTTNYIFNPNYGPIINIKCDNDLFLKKIKTQNTKIVDNIIEMRIKQIQNLLAKLNNQYKFFSKSELQFLKKLPKHNNIKKSTTYSMSKLYKLDQLVSSIPMMLPEYNPKVTSHYGFRKHPIRKQRKFHFGIDIKGCKSCNVYSAANGIITKVGRINGYGNIVEIRHSSKFSTKYAHLNKISVKEGARILQGEKIATQGNTGHATAEHLHFEILLNGKQINPFDLISHACNY